MKKSYAKAIAIACLLAAIGAVVLAVMSSEKAVHIQGPSSMVATADGTLWLGVDEELWLFGADGTRRARVDVRKAGLPGAPSQLVPHPGGAIVATVRDDPALYFIDPSSLRVTRQLTPRWPHELARHAARAIHLAIHDDGRFAIATGGGHAVALFDPEGGFIARTAVGLYEFTNGLWWTPQGLWTTDTNRFQLKLLDGATLALLRTVKLPARGPMWALGSATPHPATGDKAPLVTLFRFANGMVKGRVVDAFGDGPELGFEHKGGMEPRDLLWHGGELLVTDGLSQSVLRWSAARESLAPFGDEAARTELQQRVADKIQYRARYGWLLGAAGALFLVGLGFAIRAQRMAQTSVASAFHDTMPRGMPWSESKRQWRNGVKIVWPFVLPPILLLLLLEFGKPWLVALPAKVQLWLSLTLLALAVPAGILLAVLFNRRLRRFATQPAYEDFFNRYAMSLRRRSAALRAALRPDERVLDGLIVTQLGRATWVVQTDQRWLLFSLRIGYQVLRAAHPAVAVTAAGTRPGDVHPRRHRWLAGWAPVVGWLEIGFRDGSVLAGKVTAPTVAQRMVESARQQGAASSQAAGVASRRRSVRTAIASAIVPGLGQWIQQRNHSALGLFLVWSVFSLAISLPLAWTLFGPRAAVSTMHATQVALGQIAISAIAAFDAWANA
jgi:hypothetical protein